MTRILLLSSCVGFISRSCQIKSLVAMLIALAYSALFLWTRPCTSFLSIVSFVCVLYNIVLN